jgi:hypothetical protein
MNNPPNFTALPGQQTAIEKFKVVNIQQNTFNMLIQDHFPLMMKAITHSERCFTICQHQTPENFDLHCKVRDRSNITALCQHGWFITNNYIHPCQ